MRLLYAYATVLHGRRRTAALLVALMGLSGLLEGVALAAVMPLLNAGREFESDSLTARVLRLVSVEQDAVVPLALAAFLGLGVLSVAVRHVSTVATLNLRTSVERSMRQRTTAALLRMRWTEFLALRAGDISKSILLEGQQASGGLQSLIQAAGAALVSMLFLGFAFALSPVLTGLTLAFGSVAAIGYRWAGRLAENQATRLSASSSDIGDRVAVIFGNLKYFRSTGVVGAAEREAVEGYRDYERTLRSSQMPGLRMRDAYEGSGLLLVGLTLAAAFVVEGELTPESLVFMAVFYRLAPRLLAVQEAVHTARLMLPWLTSWHERLVVAQCAADQRPGEKEPVFVRELRAAGIGFRYPGTASEVLSGVDWVLGRAECLALVGPSGGGKTTLLDLVSGLLEPTEGRITVDGVDLRELDLQAWQSRLGVVPQDAPMFHASVLENIAWGRADVDRNRAWDCALQANAAEFIAAMPEGLDTMVGERGGRLSGGQRQRLALARALYRDPWLLILDEATSALDSEAEEVVQDALEGLKGSCAMLIVAHRLRTVRLADRIHVLDGGRIVETGGWHELLANGGRFRALATAQGLA